MHELWLQQDWVIILKEKHYRKNYFTSTYFSCYFQIPTHSFLERMICSILSNTSEDEAESKGYRADCHPKWSGVKNYILHAVSWLKLYGQVLLGAWMPWVHQVFPPLVIHYVIPWLFLRKTLGPLHLVIVTYFHMHPMALTHQTLSPKSPKACDLGTHIHLLAKRSLDPRCVSGMWDSLCHFKCHASINFASCLLFFSLKRAKSMTVI